MDDIKLKFEIKWLQYSIVLIIKECSNPRRETTLVLFWLLCVVRSLWWVILSKICLVRLSRHYYLLVRLVSSVG